MAPTLKPDADREHPLVAGMGIVAVLIAILLIVWARFEVHGTHDLEATLSADAVEPAASTRKPAPNGDEKHRDAEIEDAVAAGRWAAGFSP